MDIRVERSHAVSRAVASIRAIQEKAGITPRALDAMKGVMLELGARSDLFSLSDYPIGPEDGKSVIYRLSKEADNQFALYASVSSPGKLVPPHNHDTWAVTVGVHGEEHNVLYERTDGGRGAGRAVLRKKREMVISSGKALAMLPDDIHSIHIISKDSAIHLHMYGRALEQLSQRLIYDTAAGTCKTFPATLNIKYT